jgi:OOP family OmpA-OmpF porin
MADQKTEKKKDELKDTDGDGVLDILDKEPTTPEGYAVDAHGVTLDSDKDGCPDTKDPEPFSSPAFEIVDCKNVMPKVETPAVTEPGKSGPPYDEEPLVKRVKTVEENVWKLTSIYYDLNKYSITTPANAELKKVGLVMATNPDLKVNVQGHTDTRGSVEYNDKLSQNRVNAAIKYLKDNYGITEDRFIKLPLGKTDPLVKDAASEGQHQVNRRVDFTPAKQ